VRDGSRLRQIPTSFLGRLVVGFERPLALMRVHQRTFAGRAPYLRASRASTYRNKPTPLPVALFGSATTGTTAMPLYFFDVHDGSGTVLGDEEGRPSRHSGCSPRGAGNPLRNGTRFEPNGTEGDVHCREGGREQSASPREVLPKCRSGAVALAHLRRPGPVTRLHRTVRTARRQMVVRPPRG
jgi:hypothetical protein